MSETIIYAIIIFAYLIVLILIGFITGRRTKSVEDFYIGGRQIGPWVTALSFVAAYFSSVVIIGGGGYGYMFGMATLWIGAINVLLGCTVCWIVLGPRIRQFTQRLKTMTIPGFFGERYDSRFALVFSALIIVLFMIFYNVSILKGMKKNLNQKQVLLYSKLASTFRYLLEASHQARLCSINDRWILDCVDLDDRWQPLWYSRVYSRYNCRIHLNGFGQFFHSCFFSGTHRSHMGLRPLASFNCINPVINEVYGF